MGRGQHAGWNFEMARNRRDGRGGDLTIAMYPLQTVKARLAA